MHVKLMALCTFGWLGGCFQHHLQIFVSIIPVRIHILCCGTLCCGILKCNQVVSMCNHGVQKVVCIVTG